MSLQAFEVLVFGAANMQMGRQAETNLTAIRGEGWEGIVAGAVSCELEHICIAPLL